MKTAISVPDDVYEQVERLARRLKRSRSRLYTDAAREYLARHDPDAVTEALNRVYCDESEAGALDPALAAAARATLRRSEW